jgi:hypothetical protein
MVLRRMSIMDVVVSGPVFGGGSLGTITGTVTAADGLTKRLQTLVSPAMYAEMEEYVLPGRWGSVGSLVRAGIELELARLRALYPKAKEERQDPLEAALAPVRAIIEEEMSIARIWAIGEGHPEPNREQTVKRINRRLAVEAPNFWVTLTPASEGGDGKLKIHAGFEMESGGG